MLSADGVLRLRVGLGPPCRQGHFSRRPLRCRAQTGFYRAAIRGRGRKGRVVTVTIYHNPACGTSRNVLALIRASGEEPHVVEYLKTPPTRNELVALLARMGIGARVLLREKGTPYGELGLGEAKWTNDELVDCIVRHPILMNRPVVATEKGVKLCRPSDIVLDILPHPPAPDTRKEDGVPVLADTRVAASDGAFRAALEAAGLPTDDLDEPGRVFFAYRTLDATPVGFGGYEILGEHALVRSVVVLPQARGKEIGRNLVALLLRRAFDDGARQAWLLTTTAAAFFEKAGFQPALRQTAPQAVLATRQATSLCPASAVLLTRTITL